MPLHYALTDGLVALVAAWGCWQMARTRQFVAALGFALFALASSIGTVRITSGQIDQLAMIHKMASLSGGVAGITLLISQILSSKSYPYSNILGPIAAIGAAVIAAIYPAVGAALFVALLLTAIVLLSKARAVIGTAGFAVMLLNVIFLRKSEVLGPDISWHVFHIITAIWLFCAAISLRSEKRPDIRSPSWARARYG